MSLGAGFIHIDVACLCYEPGLNYHKRFVRWSIIYVESLEGMALTLFSGVVGEVEPRALCIVGFEKRVQMYWPQWLKIILHKI